MDFKTNIPISSIKDGLWRDTFGLGSWTGPAWLGFLGPWVGLELINMQEEGVAGFAEPRKQLSLL